MAAIVWVESGGNPYAINVNGGQRLARQARNRDEALGWATWLAERGYNIDLGLTQINIHNFPRLGLSLEQALDPCMNLKAGSQILSDNYAGAVKAYGAGQSALLAAISAYNTGNHSSGFRNGYVYRVAAAAGAPGAVAPPLSAAKRSHTPKSKTTEKSAEIRRSPIVVYTE